jgi:hypothetical protein
MPISPAVLARGASLEFNAVRILFIFLRDGIFDANVV